MKTLEFEKRLLEMYFYEIEVYHPLLGSEKIIMRHDDHFDNHQLNIIVQEAFDECIEKYIDKSVLGKGEEACRMEVETIFEEYLPLQLKNHGFKSIKINATCSIRSGALFVDGGVGNSVLKNRYKYKILPPCWKCMRETCDGKCVVPNTRKDTSLPTTCVVKTIPINLNEKETDETNIKTLKTYFNKRNKSFEDKKTAAEATNKIILNNNNIRDFWVEWGTIKEGIHKKDILCFFDTDTDEEKFKNLFINYGFILQKSKYGFWITGVKK